MSKQDRPQISIRGYEPGDENAIVDFLNLSYSKKVTDPNRWNWMHLDYPMFKKDNVFVVEVDNKMVGYRMLLLRDLSISGSRLTTASLGSTAVHPDFRGYGIYSQLHQATLQKAASQAPPWRLPGIQRALLPISTI